MPTTPINATLTTTRDLLNTIEQFRHGRLDLLSCINLLWTQTHGLEPLYEHYVGPIEDHLSDIEIIYALAAEGGQGILDEVQAEEVEKALDDIVKMLTDSP